MPGKLSQYQEKELNRYLYEKYGPIVRFESTFGNANKIFLFDADAAEYIIRSEQTTPIRPGFDSLEYYRKYYNKTYDPNRLIGIAIDRGENWRKQRFQLNPILLRPKTIKLYDRAAEEVAEDMIARIKFIRNDRNMLRENFNNEMKLWALESLGALGFGMRLNCFNPNLPKNSIVNKILQSAHNFFLIMEQLDFKPSPWRYFSTPNFRKAMKIYEEHDRLANDLFYYALKNLKDLKRGNSITPNSSSKSILENLLELDYEMARLAAREMVQGGIDSVTYTITILLYLLAKNPEKQSKLRKELIENQENKTYLKACIKESQRVLPGASGNARMTTKEYSLLGYKIPKDITIIIQHQIMSNMEKYFPKPDQFIPERWLTQKDGESSPHSFASLPFGFGVRSCIGRRIAELALETSVSKIIKNFQVTWDGPALNIKYGILHSAASPFYFSFKDIEGVRDEKIRVKLS